jgi:hypothetical protein
MAGQNDGRSAIADMLRAMLQWPRPEPLAEPTKIPAGSPNAVIGFIVAANAVMANDHALAVSDWEDQQRRLTAWLNAVEEEQLQSIEKVVRAAVTAGDPALLSATVNAAITGSARWRTIVNEVQEITAWGEWRAAESQRKHEEIAGCYRQVDAIIARHCNQLEAASDEINLQTRRILDLDETRRPLTVSDWLKTLGLNH